MNNVQLVGRLGSDAESKPIGEGFVINFSLATSRTYKDKSGEKVEKTEWHSIAYWVKNDTIAQYLVKGGLVGITGSIEYSKSEDKYFTKIVARELELLGSKSS